MTKNRIIILIMMLCFIQPLKAFAEVKMDDLTTPKDIFYRLGTGDVPENKVDISGRIDVKPAIVKEDKYYSEGLTYADLSIKKMAMEVSKSIDADYNEMLEADVISAKTDCNGSLICMTVIALKEGASAKPADVTKPLTGTVFDRNTATGLVLKADNDRYIVSFASREVPSKGFLSSCEGADSYARVFVKKNDDPVKVLKF